jgi:hypothetical protein
MKLAVELKVQEKIDSQQQEVGNCSWRMTNNSWSLRRLQEDNDELTRVSADVERQHDEDLEDHFPRMAEHREDENKPQVLRAP